ncbi:hypothetical protein ABT143_29775 [Streptomyces sp. NPDC002033]|uniref:hypothetical protein n=1 Tax=unclassified Streptomyces TaxID=2593676 RepID=UPI00332F3EA0
MSRRRTLALTTAASAIAVGLAAVAALPAAAHWYGGRHQESGSYATGAEAKGARASVPRWLPDGATSVEYAMGTTGGRRLLKATLPTGGLPPQCTDAPRSGAGKPELAASWFPQGAEDRATARCGLYYAYVQGDTLYAWQLNDDWIKDGAGR